MNKNILIVIIVVIILAAIAAFAFVQNGKTNTQINIINNETFQNGEQVKFELKDDQGKPLSGKTVEVNLNNQKSTIKTDTNGKGYISVSGLASGKYDVEVKFAGDDKYNGCDAKTTITFDSTTPADNPSIVTGESATKPLNDDTSGWTYYPEYNAWVDQNGIVVRIGDGYGEQLGVGYPLEDVLMKAYRGERIDTNKYPEFKEIYDDDTNTTNKTKQ